MARKVILDVDPGIDDAVALCMALFDPRLDVVAVTATAGNISAEHEMFKRSLNDWIRHAGRELAQHENRTMAGRSTSGT